MRTCFESVSGPGIPALAEEGPPARQPWGPFSRRLIQLSSTGGPGFPRLQKRRAPAGQRWGPFSRQLIERSSGEGQRRWATVERPQGFATKSFTTVRTSHFTSKVLPNRVNSTCRPTLSANATTSFSHASSCSLLGLTTPSSALRTNCRTTLRRSRSGALLSCRRHDAGDPHGFVEVVSGLMPMAATNSLSKN